MLIDGGLFVIMIIAAVGTLLLSYKFGEISPLLKGLSMFLFLGLGIISFTANDIGFTASTEKPQITTTTTTTNETIVAVTEPTKENSTFYIYGDGNPATPNIQWLGYLFFALAFGAGFLLITDLMN